MQIANSSQPQEGYSTWKCSYKKICLLLMLDDRVNCVPLHLRLSHAKLLKGSVLRIWSRDSE